MPMLTLALVLAAAPGLGSIASGATAFSLDQESASLQGIGRSPAVSWERSAGRFGGPALKVACPSQPEPVRFLLFDAPRPLPSPDQYRAEAWARNDTGRCSITLVMYDASTGRERGRHSVLDIEGAAEWRYGACDVPWTADSSELAHNLEVLARGGDAIIGGVRVQTSDSILFNGSFRELEEALPSLVGMDGQQPVPVLPIGWRRVVLAPDCDGQAAGYFRVERGHGTSTLVTKAEGEFILCGPPAVVPEDSLGFVARARIDRLSAVVPSLVLREYGRHGLVRETASLAPVVPHDGRDELALSTPLVRRNRQVDRLVVWLRFPRRAGTCRVRSVALHSLAEHDSTIRVFVDQVGYDSGDPVRIVLSTGVFPPTGQGRLELAKDGRQVYEGPLLALGRGVGQDGADWGSYCFAGVARHLGPGTYAVKALLDHRTASLESITVGHNLHLRETGELAYRFFTVQRCGCAVPGWHGPCHTDDGKLPDGTHVDAAGGYHNAGDYGKWTGDNAPLAVYAMLMAYQAWRGFFDGIDGDKNGRADLLDEAVWGADWLLKMVDPKTGRLWAAVDAGPDYFGIPEKETDGVPGTSDDRTIRTEEEPHLAAFAMAAWAALSRLGLDGKYLSAAERAWTVYEADIMAGANPRHMLAAFELYRATQDEAYIRAADHLAERILQLQTPEGAFTLEPNGPRQLRVIEEGMIPAALACYALERRPSPLATSVEAAIRRYYAWSFRTADNPFGIIRNDIGAGPFYFMERRGLYVGNNSQYLSIAWAALLAERLFSDDPVLAERLKAHATNHIYWLLGCNPLGLCMFEGKGNSGRIYYHHRYADIPEHARGAVPGAIPNGMIRDPQNADRPWFNLSAIPFPLSYSSNEPWLPHNANYLLMLSALANRGPRGE